MKMKKIFRLGFLAISASLIFSPALHAENTLFGKINSDQKRWVGKTAPAFKLQDQNAKWHELKQYKGKWVVLYFYPKDNTPGCTQEANQFKTLYPQFIKNNASGLVIWGHEQVFGQLGTRAVKSVTDQKNNKDEKKEK